jgi:hypothetical protein
MFSGVTAFAGVLLLLTTVAVSPAQVQKKSAVPSGKEVALHGANLAENGHCTEALPLLKKAIHQTLERDLKKRVGLDGIHCAMT